LIAARDFSLGKEARAAGVRLVAFEEIDSTNEEAKRLARDLRDTGPLWIVGVRQSGGRGRLGRAWISPTGNLHASLLLGGAFGVERAPQLGFVAGVAAISALHGLAPTGAELALKWPNDLLLGRAKLGGILLEGLNFPSEDGGARSCVVVGVGINCVDAPEGLPYPARSLRSLGPQAPSASLVFAALSDAFVEALDEWRGGEGFAAIRAKWLAAAAGIGETISVELARGEKLKGRFESIDADGRLLIAAEGGLRAIDAGDVLLAHEPPREAAGLDQNI